MRGNEYGGTNLHFSLLGRLVWKHLKLEESLAQQDPVPKKEKRNKQKNGEVAKKNAR